MEQVTLDIMKAALDARLANLALVLIVVLIVAIVAIFYLMRPVFLRTVENQGLLVQNIATLEQVLRIVGERNQTLVQQSEHTMRAISALRDDLNKHMVHVNLRFDQLPSELQQLIGAEIVRHLQTQPPRFKLWEFLRGK